MQLFSLVQLAQIREQYALTEYRLLDFAVGCDDAVYLLFCGPCGSPFSLADLGKPTHFVGIRVYVDWNNRELLGTAATDFGTLPFNFYLQRPLGEEILLLGGRCPYGRQNALVMDSSGKQCRTMCLGDGIETCITTPDGRIITGYFDEGVLGNLGWETPIGAPGLIVWDARGNPLWKNSRYDILDCYAMDLDGAGRLWFHYYPGYQLVCTDFSSDTVWDIPMEETNLMIVSQKADKILLAENWNTPTFGIYRVPVEKTAQVTPHLHGRRLTKAQYHGYGGKLLIVTEDETLCAYWLQ